MSSHQREEAEYAFRPLLQMQPANPGWFQVSITLEDRGGVGVRFQPIAFWATCKGPSGPLVVGVTSSDFAQGDYKGSEPDLANFIVGYMGPSETEEGWTRLAIRHYLRNGYQPLKKPSSLATREEAEAFLQEATRSPGLEEQASFDHPVLAGRVNPRSALVHAHAWRSREKPLVMVIGYDQWVSGWLGGAIYREFLTKCLRSNDSAAHQQLAQGVSNVQAGWLAVAQQQPEIGRGAVGFFEEQLSASLVLVKDVRPEDALERFFSLRAQAGRPTILTIELRKDETLSPFYLALSHQAHVIRLDP
jgi:hypothetical protein